MSSKNSSSASAENFGSNQFSTFYIADRLYGITVSNVQEVVKPLAMTNVPLAPRFVKGLVNLRGQVATAIGLRELLEYEPDQGDQLINVVCQHNGFLVSFLVDEIGDVVELNHGDFEQTPQTIPQNIRRFMQGVYKQPGALLSILDVEKMLTVVQSDKL